MYSPLAYQAIPLSYTHYMGRSKKVNAVVVHYTASIVREAVNTVNFWENLNPYTSANYIIDVFGRITSVVPEEKRSFCSSSWNLGIHDIDDRAITIECSCNYVPPNINDQANYTQSEETITACCELLADIATRWGIDKWVFVNDPAGNSGNIHAHRWYGDMSGSPTPCPGDQLYAKLPEIAFRANKIMESDDSMTIEERKEFDELKANVDKLTEAVTELAKAFNSHTAVKYNYIDDLPKNWGRSEISWLVSKGYLNGTEAGLNLSYDMLRECCINARAFEDIDKSLTDIKKTLDIMAEDITAVLNNSK